MKGEPGEAFFYIKSGLLRFLRYLRMEGTYSHILDASHIRRGYTVHKTVYPATAEVMEDSR